MIRYFLRIFLLTCLSARFCYSQDAKSYEFIGVLKLDGESFITYKLNFKELGNNKIEGYSITDFYGTQKTKSKITGIFDESKKIISFHETNNLSTKSDANENEFCYVHVKNIKLKTKNNKLIIDGKFQGKFENDSNCIAGSIILTSTNFLTSDSSSSKSSSIVSQLLNKTEEDQLKTNDQFTLTWNSDKLMLEIWDAAKEDDDKITLYINDKIYLENYNVTNQKKIIEIPAIEPSYTLKIIAIDEGKTPPNTVNIKLIDGKASTPIVTNLKKGEVYTIVIKKRKQK